MSSSLTSITTPLAHATVCVDPNRLFVASVGFCDVNEVSWVRQLVEVNFSVNLLYVRSVSFPDVVALGCLFSFDYDWCGSSRIRKASLDVVPYALAISKFMSLCTLMYLRLFNSYLRTSIQTGAPSSKSGKNAPL
jgi:hypothetical protein